MQLVHNRHTLCLQKGVYSKACTCVAQPPEGLTHSGSAMTSMLQCRQPCLRWPTSWHCLCSSVHCLVTSASQNRVTKRSSHNKLFSIALGYNWQQLMIASKGCARQVISKASSNALYTSHPSSSAIVWLLLQNPSIVELQHISKI